MSETPKGALFPQTALTMQEIKFLVQGSAPDPYEVHFIQREGHNLSAYCTCPAGMIGKSCKHRVNILLGIDKGVVSDNRQDVATVSSWLTGSDIQDAMNAVINLEAEADRIKEEITKAKKALGRAMMN